MKLIVASSKTKFEEFSLVGSPEEHLLKLTAITKGRDLDEYTLMYFENDNLYAFVISNIQATGLRSFSAQVIRGENEFNPPLSAHIEL